MLAVIPDRAASSVETWKRRNASLTCSSVATDDLQRSHEDVRNSGVQDTVAILLKTTPCIEGESDT